MHSLKNALRESVEWDEIAPYLDRALDLQPHERETWLGELTTHQPEIAASLRRLLLDYDELNERRFLAGSAVGPARETEFELWLDLCAADEAEDVVRAIRQAVGPTGNLSISPTAGTMLGAYRLVREIGHGGMSSVWLAERCYGHLQREVALKLPFEGPRRAQLAERFRRECDILATLTHPNIARLYDAGVSAAGQPYLAMEYVHGLPLTQYCDDACLDLTARLTIFLQVLAAVEFAHTQLVLHRDLKPSNILVTSTGRVVLLDFGIAKLLSHEQSPDSPLTEMAGRIMTPDYASPEHIEGRPIGTTSDVFSLGVVLCELLVGTRPFGAGHQSRHEIEKAILTQETPPPSTIMPTVTAAAARSTTPRKLQTTLRGDLDAIVLKALAKSPCDRYLSSGALAQDIANYLACLPVSAQAACPWYRLRRFVGRHKSQCFAAAVTIFTLVFGISATLWQARVAEQERVRAVALASRNDSINEFLSTLITDAAASATPITVNEMLARSEELALADRQGNSEGRAAVLGMIASQYHALGDTVRAERLLASALSLVDEKTERGFRSQLICAHAVAGATMQTSAAAAATMQRELAGLSDDPENASYCSMYLAFLAQDVGDGEAMLRYALQGLKQYRAGAHASAVDEGVLLGTIGRGYQLIGRNSDADRYYREAMQTFNGLGRDKSANAISMRNNWALVSTASGAPKLALQQYEEILRLVAARGPEQRVPVYVPCNQARAQEMLGRHEAARTTFAQGLRQAIEQKSVEVQLRCLVGLVSSSVDLHDPQAAAGYLDQLAATFGSKRPTTGPAFQSFEVVSGKLDLEKGDYDSARAHFSRALSFESKGVTMVMAHLGKAETELRAGDPEAAAAAARDALELSTAAQGEFEFSNLTGLSWLMLGRTFQARGETELARTPFESAAKHLARTVDEKHPELLRVRRLIVTTTSS